MKKIVSLSLICLLFLVSFIPVVGAEKSIKESLVFEKDEITDIDVLYELALNGITDVEDLPITVHAAVKKLTKDENTVLLNSDIVDDMVVDILTTTQKLKEVEMENGVSITEYSTTVFATSEQRPRSGEDPTKSVRANLTIFWNEKIEAGLLKRQMTRVSGGWTILDSSVSLSNRVVRYGSSGPECPSSCSREVNPTTNSFNYSISNWPYVTSGTFISHFGANSNVTMTRGSSTWQFPFFLNLE